MPRGRIENLRPFTHDQDREAAKRNGRKGGLASGRARRERAEKRLKEIEKKYLKPWERCLEKSTYSRLSWRHQRFIMEFILHLGNAAAAARAAGYSPRWAKNIGYRLLRRREIWQGLRCFNAYIDHKTDPADYPGSFY